MAQYDYLIIGAGLFGAVFAHEMKAHGRSVLVVEKRSHIGGNVYTENVDGIEVHSYGAHIFHTNKEAIWNYVNKFVFMRPFVNSPIANYRGELYPLPFNMNTFYALWKVRTPQEAAEKLLEQRAEFADVEPKNLAEQACKLVGRDIYEKLIRGYTEKQWGRKAEELPAFIIKRIPVRLTFDNNYFNDIFQGIPSEGYTTLVRRLLEGVDVRLGVDFFANRYELEKSAEKIVFTGRIDQYFDSCYGSLEYRSLQFESEHLSVENYQGVAVVNYTDAEIPYTRIIEHKHFSPVDTSVTIITREYPQAWKEGREPYYPVNDEDNMHRYEQYRKRAEKHCPHLILGGRLGTYRYYNMDQIIEQALECAQREVSDSNFADK
jgi:UDP-galactopyranose mutase